MNGANSFKHWFPNIVVLLWLTFLGVTIWQCVERTEEPPIYDALNYVEKARNFWLSFEKEGLVNPFNVEPRYRPPGTILMSYPFGLESNLRGFFFRSVFFPVLAFVVAIYLIGYCRGMVLSQKWNLVLIAIFLSTLPMFYHFEPSVHINSPIYWGLVDNFLAGVSALAVAACFRSVIHCSLGWLVAGALLAAFSILIKPAGGLVMALTGVSWFFATTLHLRTDKKRFARFLILGLLAMSAIYAMVLLLSFSSAYLSPQNIEFGKQATAILHAQWAPGITVALLLSMAHVSFGKPLLLLTVVAGSLAIAYRKRPSPPGSRGIPLGAFVLAASLSLALGVWFWIVATGVDQIRYFYPFALMILTCAVPVGMYVMEKIPRWGRVTVRILCILPALNLAFLLIQSSPPAPWQRMTGVNLTSGLYKEEIQQARMLIDQVGKEAKNILLYSLFSGTPNTMIFENVLRYESLLHPRPKIEIQLPVSWYQGMTYRLNEILESDYILFKPVLNRSEKMVSLSQKNVKNFPQEIALMHAWFTDLGEKDGVTTLLETPSLRLLKVVDRGRLETRLETMKRKYEWRPIFMEANNQQLARYHLSISTQRTVEIVNETDPQYRGIVFGDKFTLLGQQIIKAQDGLQVQLIWKSLVEQELSYQHAIHLLDDGGQGVSTLDYAQDKNRNIVKAGTVWLDKIDLPRNKLEKVVSLGVGIYTLPDLKLLSVDEGPRDLDAKRLLLQLRTVHLIDSKVASDLVNKADPGYRNISFGDRFMLAGVRIIETAAGLRVLLVWRSLKEQPLQYYNAIHLVDRHLNALSTLDYPQDIRKTVMKVGTFWMDELEIPRSKLEDVVSVAVGIYSFPDMQLLSVDKGPRDGVEKRLLIPLSKSM